MKLKQIAILLSGAALSATVLGASAANIGDETDTSWQYTPTAKPFFAGNQPAQAKQAVRIGDENDTSWEYLPKAKPFFASDDVSGKQAVRFGDENDASWLYVARSSKVAL
jgi:hypothetical protein